MSNKQEVFENIVRSLKLLTPIDIVLKKEDGVYVFPTTVLIYQFFEKAWDHQQARIDELMFEWCPKEMTPEQIQEYEKHVKVSDVSPDFMKKIS